LALNKTKADYKVSTIPKYKGQLTDFGYSGFVDYDEHKHTFFWYFESKKTPSTDPLVIWFTGGPGCSGLDALFRENGPFQ